MEDKITQLVNRLWNDVAGLPWHDANWANNEITRDSARQHFVSSAVYDILKVVNEENSNAGEEK